MGGRQASGHGGARQLTKGTASASVHLLLGILTGVRGYAGVLLCNVMNRYVLMYSMVTVEN